MMPPSSIHRKSSSNFLSFLSLLLLSILFTTGDAFHVSVNLPQTRTTIGATTTTTSSSTTNPNSSRRMAAPLTTMAAGSPTLVPTTPMPPKEKTGLGSKLYFTSFLPPWGARDTVRTQVSEDIFLLEQAQTFVNVSVNIRSTVIRLKNGDLFVHAPIAPTAECISLLKELGTVKYIVLPVTAIEHKTFMSSFVKKFPDAQVYVAPGQFSWPVDLPLGFRVDGVLTEENKEKIPFRDEIDYTGWFFKPFAGSISEVAFFHKKSKSLIVTDAAIYIDDQPPAILQQRGVKPELWKKMALQACFLGPPNLDTFEEIKQRLIVSPVIKILVISRAKKEVGAWINRVCQWKFERIIPAHFSAPIKAGPQNLKDAYAFLEEEEEEEEEEAAAAAGAGGLKRKQASSAPIFDFSALLSGGGRSKPAKRRNAVVFPKKDTKILEALDKFVSATGLAN